MNIAKKYTHLFIFCFFCFALAGCATVPSAARPLAIQHAYSISFDRTWDAVLEVAKASQGKIVTEDKPSGLIVYSVFDKGSKAKIYIQVLIKPSDVDKGSSLVYIFPHNTKGYCSGAIQDEFFKSLKNILES